MPDALWENLRLAFVRQQPNLFGSPFQFRRCGESGEQNAPTWPQPARERERAGGRGVVSINAHQSGAEGGFLQRGTHLEALNVHHLRSRSAGLLHGRDRRIEGERRDREGELR